MSRKKEDREAAKEAIRDFDAGKKSMDSTKWQDRVLGLQTMSERIIGLVTLVDYFDQDAGLPRAREFFRICLESTKDRSKKVREKAWERLSAWTRETFGLPDFVLPIISESSFENWRMEDITRLIGIVVESKNEKALDVLIRLDEIFFDEDIADDFAELPEEIAKALQKTGDERAIPLLLKYIRWEPALLIAPDGTSATLPIAREEALVALGSVGNKETIPEIMEFLDPDIMEFLDWGDGSGGIQKSAADALAMIEYKNPGSVDLEAVKEKLHAFVEKRSDSELVRQVAAARYLEICEVISELRKRIDMSGEVLPDKPKPPGGKTFRRRTLHS
ncbi:HEAT repeat domain-containing protein [Candidatus Micrarchaeota archaeon]|nr:HEAT repeat domain-containing protein [Candidatus Micrarchaeota archaeon]